MTTRPSPIVVALGGNALAPADGSGDITEQFKQTRKTAREMVSMLMSDVPVVITHGNGPQVGEAVRRVELSEHEVYPLDLGLCVADLQGGMGYMIAQCLTKELQGHGCDRTVSTIVTSVEVDQADPAFADPTKPIGSYYDKKRAEHCIKDLGWKMVQVRDLGYRRVVPSPLPKAILEIHLIRRLVEAGEILVAAGGGGVPVLRRETPGGWDGCEAVIDKDRASSLLAREVGAETLIIITNVGQVCLDFGKPTERNLDHLTMADAEKHLADGQFPPGSMGPKIDAAIEFLRESPGANGRVIISDIEHMTAAFEGRGGTTLTRD